MGRTRLTTVGVKQTDLRGDTVEGITRLQVDLGGDLLAVMEDSPCFLLKDNPFLLGRAAGEGGEDEFIQSR